MPFDELRIPTFLATSDFSDKFRLFDDFFDEFLRGSKLLTFLKKLIRKVGSRQKSRKSELVKWHV